MTLEEAKLILQCRRPCGSDDQDAVIREALALTAADPEAQAQLERDRAVDAAICECLRRVEPPPGLRQEILAGRMVTRRSPWYRRPVWWLSGLGVAATLAAGIPAARHYFLPGPGTPGPVFASISLADFRAAVAQKLNEGPKINPLRTMEDVQRHLAKHAPGAAAAIPVTIPEKLCHCAGGMVGCEIFQVNGREVTLICFDAGDAGTVHLFTVCASALETPPGVTPVYQPANGWQTFAWTRDGRVMVLAGCDKKTTPRDLEALVKDAR